MEMKVSISTVKRVWTYELKNREAVPIKKSDRTLKRLPERYAKKANVFKHVTCHSFRHYVITSLIS
jgi:hypothetical protein